ncbi:MAG: hypothetical protein MPW17_02870 [Candidatus Manganitrophus sp.]|nr:MAG: hypothetical protein MPW17_02870 [Candidatus Manganitrophus sp.]
MPPPVPPSVNEGRMIDGNPVSATTASASSTVARAAALGILQAGLLDGPLERLPVLGPLIASSFAPIISTPYFSSTPCSSSASAQLSAVCPPIVGSSASGRSFSMISFNTSTVIGSM